MSEVSVILKSTTSRVTTVRNIYFIFNNLLFKYSIYVFSKSYQIVNILKECIYYQYYNVFLFHNVGLRSRMSISLIVWGKLMREQTAKSTPYWSHRLNAEKENAAWSAAVALPATRTLFVRLLIEKYKVRGIYIKAIAVVSMRNIRQWFKTEK